MLQIRHGRDQTTAALYAPPPGEKGPRPAGNSSQLLATTAGQLIAPPDDSMASQILAQATEKVQNMTGERSQKVIDLSHDTKDVHDKSWRITSDYGVKQTNTDDWLKVVNEDKTGPMLLEDPFAREKVCLLSFHPSDRWRSVDMARSIALTTNAFQSVSSTRAERVPMASSRCLSLPQTSLRPVS